MSWLLLAGLSSSLLGTQAIDFEPGFATTDKVIAELAKHDSTNMRVSAGLSRRVLGVSASGQTPQQIRDRIAECLQATWQKEGETLLLTQTSAQRDEIKSSSLRFREENMATELKELSAQIEAIPPLDEAGSKKIVEELTKPFESGQNVDYYRKREKIKDGLPSTRLMVQLLNAIGPKQLCSVEGGQRVVFSTSPNRSQVGIPKNVDKIFNEFLAQEVILESATKTLDSEKTASLTYYGVSSPQRRTVKVNISVYGYPFGMMMTKMVGLDAKGFMTFRQERQLGARNFEVLESNKDSLMKDTDLVELSEQSAKISQTFLLLSQPTAEKSSDGLDILREPLKHEPLGFANSEAIQFLAKKFRKPVYASLSDSAIMALFLARGEKKISLKAYTGALEASKHNLDSSGECIFIRPKDVVDTESSFTDRKVVQGLFDKSMNTGRVSLDDVGAILNQIGSMKSKLMLLMYMQAGFFGTTLQSSMSNEEVVRFYGSLSTDQKNALKSGKQLGLMDFTAKQKENLIAVVFHRENTNINSPFPESTQDYQGWSEGASREPTEIYPNGGLEPNFAVQVTYSKGDGWFADLGGFEGLKLANASTIAFAYMRKERPDIFGQTGAKSIEDVPFYKGEAISWQFSFILAPEVSMSDVLNDDSPIKDKPYKKKDLPEELLKQVDDQIKNLREAYKDVGVGRDNKNPPPTR